GSFSSMSRRRRASLAVRRRHEATPSPGGALCGALSPWTCAMPAVRSVAIIGGGFSGALQAINLVRHDGPKAILIERRPEVGRGIAYSTAPPGHLLNVRAANMSALPDEPDHFLKWLARQGYDQTGEFAPRAL